MKERIDPTEAQTIERMCEIEGLLGDFRLNLGQALDRLRSHVNGGVEQSHVRISLLVTTDDGRQAISDGDCRFDLTRYYQGW